MTAEYGSWKSPVTSSMVSEKSVFFQQVVLDDVPEKQGEICFYFHSSHLQSKSEVFQSHKSISAATISLFVYSTRSMYHSYNAEKNWKQENESTRQPREMYRDFDPSSGGLINNKNLFNKILFPILMDVFHRFFNW